MTQPPEGRRGHWRAQAPPTRLRRQPCPTVPRGTPTVPQSVLVDTWKAVSRHDGS